MQNISKVTLNVMKEKEATERICDNVTMKHHKHCCEFLAFYGVITQSVIQSQKGFFFNKSKI